MKGLDKNKLAAIAALAAAAIIVLIVLLTSGSQNGSDISTAENSLSVFSSTSPDTTTTESAVTETTASASQTTTTATTTTAEPEKEYISYSFRTRKQFDDHYKKHGSEFGDISQEEYLQLANDLLNSDSDTVLHKLEAEDGDDVFFDTETGYFLVLSTDGYIRTFFIPSAGKAYFDRQ